MKLISTLIIASLLAFSAPLSAADYVNTTWKELVPEGYEPPPVRSQAFYEANPELANQPELDAPVVESLDGKKVKIPGYVVQLEGDAERVTEFLLVPYFGACVHVPPPPPNQIILVKFPEGVKYEDTFDAVWVEGTMHVERAEGEVAVVGYQLTAATVTPYY
ncbi:DUF3299 domain-containing protein [Pseudidiomarina sp.]|uniref:DUF3299 domain-containing protein n=1 Tax=Pseudidiomarina sp. TaxID=2081707 RepID=UPI00299D94C8|nr:DUF3299 domain-containing protein [Pseudidiomarina sp.]MDX1706434.1 DUF3299 domain-containing protein [Pseudidiomarina sp.]